MNHQTDIARTLRTWFAIDAPDRPPEAMLERVFATVATSQPRPAWQTMLTTPVMRTQSRLLVGSPTMRLAAVATVVVALAVAVIVAIALASRPAVSADELVQLSKAAHADPPPFTMTISAFDLPDAQSYPGCYDTPDPEPIRYLYFYDGRDGFRHECLRPGMDRGQDFEVRKGSSAGAWRGSSWRDRPETVTFVKQPGRVFYLNWDAAPPELEELTREVESRDGLIDCPEWILGGREMVAGRPAWRVGCGDEHYWIDEASHLLVKRQVGQILISEALMLEVGTVPGPELFTVRPPLDTRRALVVGQLPPDWTLPLYDTALDGSGQFSSASFGNRPAVILFHLDGCQCIEPREFAQAAAVHGDRISAVVIGTGHYPAATIEQVTRTGVPMVRDDGASAPAWEAGPGTLAFIDAGGRVAALTQHRSFESLTGALEAFLAGRPIPAPPRGDGAFAVGDPAPALRGTLLTRDADGTLAAGGEFDLAGLAGKPVIVLNAQSLWPNHPEDQPVLGHVIVELARAKAALGDDAHAVVIAWLYYANYQRTTWLGMWRGVLSDVADDVGPDLDQLLLIDGESVAPDAWGRNWGALEPPGAPRGDRSTAIVVLDADGRVMHILDEPLPTADELVELVRSIEAGVEP